MRLRAERIGRSRPVPERRVLSFYAALAALPAKRA